MFGEPENKPYSIWNYTLFILFARKIQLDKLGWNTVTDIIRMEYLIATE